MGWRMEDVRCEVITARLALDLRRSMETLPLDLRNTIHIPFMRTNDMYSRRGRNWWGTEFGNQGVISEVGIWYSETGLSSVLEFVGESRTIQMAKLKQAEWQILRQNETVEPRRGRATHVRRTTWNIPSLARNPVTFGIGTYHQSRCQRVFMELWEVSRALHSRDTQ